MTEYERFVASRDTLQRLRTDWSDASATFATMARRSSQVANFLRSSGLVAGDRVSPYKRIRCIEFADLPKTISGKIRRVELRAQERARTPGGAARKHEFWEAELNAAGT